MRTKLLLLTILLLAAFLVPAQTISNGGFEAWTNGTPDGWDTSNEDMVMFGVSNVMADEVHAKEGNMSLMAHTVATAFFTMSGIACNGFYEGPNPTNGETETIKGSPFAGKPDSLALWYMCEPMANDSALIAIHFFKGGNLIGKGEKVEKDTVSDWTNLQIPINWSSEEMPDTMLILIKSSYGTTHDKGNAVAGSKIWIDDLRLINVTTNVEQLVRETSRVYPNPFREKITIESGALDEARIRIYNINGQVMYSATFKARTEISTENFSSGLYFLQIETAKGKEAYKITKQ